MIRDVALHTVFSRSGPRRCLRSDFLTSIFNGSQDINRISTYGSAVPKKSACGSPSARSNITQISVISRGGFEKSGWGGFALALDQ